jgi:hypothetical protein
MIFYEQILREFQKQDVKYVLVGGIAVNLLGSLRNTADMDILVAMEDHNLRKIVEILKSNGYGSKQPIDPMGIADKATREDWISNKNMKAFNFYKNDGLEEVDIIIDSPVTYAQAIKDAIIIYVEDLKICVISIDKLIYMKKTAGRDIDKLDIKELEMIKKLKESQ